jgi:HEAT repeat protein
MGMIRFAVTAALMVGGFTAQAAPTPASSEAELIAILQGDGPEADKALACKFVAVNGSAAAVPAVAPLLKNPRLASWARITLEAIPGDAASAALRDAAGTLDGRLLAGVITSLGVRGDAAAVPMLSGKLAAEDAEVAAAAACSLGRIATPEAGVLLAGAIIAKGMAGVPLLVETLASPTKRLANMATFTARDLGRGDAADPALAAEVDQAVLKQVEFAAAGGRLDRAAVLIDVLAERNAGAARESVVAGLAGMSAAANPKPLRLAAIEALGKVGDAAVVGPLLVAAADEDSGIADTARAAVAALSGDAVDREIVSRLQGGDAKILPVLVELVGRRRINAVAALLPLASHPDEKVRMATIVALGPTVDLANLDVLVIAVTAPKSQAEGEAARAAVREASVRMPDRDGCAAKLAAALEKAPAEAKVMLLDVIGEVGGTKAVATMDAAARSGDEALEDAATRLLGKWMTADAAPVLLALATAEPGGKFKTRALRGYIRIARQFVLPDAERAEMCRKVLAAAKEDADRKAVLEILVRYPSSATLAVAEEAAKTPGLEADAKKAADEIRAKVQPAKKAG